MKSNYLIQTQKTINICAISEIQFIIIITDIYFEAKH